MDDGVDPVVADLFEERLLTLYDYGRKMLLLYQGDSGDTSQPVPPEDFLEVPVDLRVEWITLAGVLGMSLTHLAGQVGSEIERRRVE